MDTHLSFDRREVIVAATISAAAAFFPLSAVGSPAQDVPGFAMQVQDPDAALVALYDRFSAIDRLFNAAHMPDGMEPAEFERQQEALYAESRAILATLSATTPAGPLGAACIALALIRDCEEAMHHPDFLGTWDGYSRPPAAILSDRIAAPLWTIAQWGLRQSGRFQASA